MQNFLAAFLMCFAFSMAGVFGATAAGVPPLTIEIAAILGMYANVAVTMLIAYPIRDHVVRLLEARESKGKKRSRFHTISERYGAKAVGLLAPTSVGTWPGALIGIAIGLRRRDLIIWLAIGIPFWVTFYTFLLSLIPRG